MAYDPRVISEIIRIGREVGANRRELVGALAGGIVESGLQNLNYGDRDSLGVYQQRKSIYGQLPLEQQIRAFFSGARGTGGEYKKGLLDTRGMKGLGKRVQAVQISAFPDRYREQLPEARQLLQQYGGNVGPRTINLVQLGRALKRMGYDVGEHGNFGGTPTSGHSPNSHHYSDNALDINWRLPARARPNAMDAAQATEAHKLGQLGRALKNAGVDELFYPGNDPVGGHGGHLHTADTDGQIKVTNRLARLLGNNLKGGGGRGNPSFPVPGVPGSSFTGNYDVPEYPTTPLPIPAATLADYSERRAAAQRDLEETRLARRRGRGDIRGDFKRFLADLNVDTRRQREAVMDQASARNLAFQPAFVAPEIKRVREDRSATLSTAVDEKQDRLRALDDAVNLARNVKQDTVAGITRDRARVRSELDRLIGI